MDEHDEGDEPRLPSPRDPSEGPREPSSGQSAYVPPSWDDRPSMPPGQADEQLAPFGWRSLGYLIDALIVYFGGAILIAIVSGLHAGVVIALLLQAAIPIVYAGLLIAKWNGQTLGMRVASLRATDATTLGPVSTSQSFTRSVSAEMIQLLPALIYPPLVLIAVPLDLLWPLWDKRNQTLHDKIGRTVVLRPVTTPAPPVV